MNGSFNVVILLPGTVVANLKSMDRGMVYAGASPSYTRNITYQKRVAIIS
jgi:hypothetical protein